MKKSLVKDTLEYLKLIPEGEWTINEQSNGQGKYCFLGQMGRPECPAHIRGETYLGGFIIDSFPNRPFPYELNDWSRQHLCEKDEFYKLHQLNNGEPNWNMKAEFKRCVVKDSPKQRIVCALEKLLEKEDIFEDELVTT